MTKSGPAHIYSDDGTLDPNSGASVYVNLLMEAMAKCGRPFLDASRLRQLLEDAGFVAVESFAIKQPWGPWARDRMLKQVGAMFLQQSESGETDHQMPMCRADQRYRIRGVWHCAFHPHPWVKPPGRCKGVSKRARRYQEQEYTCLQFLVGLSTGSIRPPSGLMAAVTSLMGGSRRVEPKAGPGERPTVGWRRAWPKACNCWRMSFLYHCIARLSINQHVMTNSTPAPC